jgi:hypothetical protein
MASTDVLKSIPTCSYFAPYRIAPITVIALSPPVPFHPLGESEELDESPHALFLTAARKSLGSRQLGDTMEARPKQFR